jgi:hypothetical protein
MEEKLKNATQKLRQTYLNILGEQIANVELEMVKTIRSMGNSDSELLTKTAMALILEEMLAANALVSALKYGGAAKSIVLISSKGQAFNLLNVQELDENSLINECLDNYKSQKQKP